MTTHQEEAPDRRPERLVTSEGVDSAGKDRLKRAKIM
jgi:hypothetical protein